jgi:hypothetical protein
MHSHGAWQTGAAVVVVAITSSAGFTVRPGLIAGLTTILAAPAVPHTRSSARKYARISTGFFWFR